MEDKNKIIVVNSNMVQMLMQFRDDYQAMTSSLPKFTLALQANECKYVHVLLFLSSSDRDRAFSIMKEYQTEDAKIKFPFFYKGEYVTADMIKMLNQNHGDFSSWEGLYHE